MIKYDDIKMSDGINFDDWWSKLRVILRELQDSTESKYHADNVSYIQNDYKEFYEDDLTPWTAATMEIGRLNVGATIAGQQNFK